MSLWRFCEVLELSVEEEDEVWDLLIKMKKEGKQTDEIAKIVLEKSKEFDRNKMYLWSLVLGKFFGLHGV
jgi:hypothetical protein